MWGGPVWKVWIDGHPALLRLQSDSCRPRNAMARSSKEMGEFLPAPRDMRIRKFCVHVCVAEARCELPLSHTVPKTLGAVSITLWHPCGCGPSPSLYCKISPERV